MTLGNDNGTDGQTDGQTDRQTDRRTDRVRRIMRPPPREEGRIITQRYTTVLNMMYVEHVILDILMVKLAAYLLGVSSIVDPSLPFHSAAATGSGGD